MRDKYRIITREEAKAFLDSDSEEWLVPIKSDLRTELEHKRTAVIEAARRADGPITLMLYRRAILDDEERRIVEDFIGKVRTVEALDKAEADDE